MINQETKMNNRKVLKSIIAGLLSISFINGSAAVNPIKAENQKYWPEGPSICSPNAIVMEVNTGAILYEKDSHKQRYPASITKIMTTMLAIENCDMDEIVTFSADAVYKNEGDTSHISRDLDEQMTVEQCLYGIMLESANECAYAIAEHVGQKLGGDYRTFIDLMNEKAKELGCTETHFNNSNGLPDEKHKTSAHDMALISSAAYKLEEFRTITGTKSYMIPATNKHKTETPLNNHHKILHPYKSGYYVNEYCTGGKTGYTVVAKSTLVTYAQKDGLTLCVVVLYDDSPNHWTDTNKLIDYCFNHFKAHNIVENEESIRTESNESLGVLNSNESFVTLDSEAYIVLPNSVDFEEATFERDDNPQNESVAALKYTYEGHNVGSVEIVATGASVEDSFYSSGKIKPAKKVIKIKPVYIVTGFLLIAFLIIAIYFIKKFYDNFYVIKHNREVRRMRKERFRTKRERRRRPRKKDRLFK